jgi:hypothetical protein
MTNSYLVHKQSPYDQTSQRQGKPSDPYDPILKRKWAILMNNEDMRRTYSLARAEARVYIYRRQIPFIGWKATASKAGKEMKRIVPSRATRIHPLTIE